jgi:hypothetical protein
LHSDRGWEEADLLEPRLTEQEREMKGEDHKRVVENGVGEGVCKEEVRVKVVQEGMKCRLRQLEIGEA